MHRSQGLTLLELLVVLAILSALGTVMIVQTTGLTDEARYQQTVRTLEDLRVAVIGRQPVGAEDPTAVPPGFVSDMGRLPQADADLTLAELWDPDPFVAADLLYRPRTVAGLDDELEILCGWRGPYFRLPIGTSVLRDGWGGPFILTDSAGGPVDLLRDPIGLVASAGPGVGGAFDANPAAPFEVVFANAARSIDQVTGSLPLDSVRVLYTLPDTAVNVGGVVRIYEISNGAPSLLVQSVVFTGTIDDTTERPVIFEDAAGSPRRSIMTGRGPKIIVAYQVDEASPPPDDPADPDAQLAGQAKSVIRFTLPAGGLASLPSPIALFGE